LQQARAPFRENRCDLVGVFLGYELVEPRPYLEQCGIEGCLAPVMRMQVELAVRRSVLRVKRKGQTAQACGKQRCRGSLATPDQKVAAAGIDRGKIDGAKVDRTTRLLGPTQSNAPSITTCGTEI